LEFYFSFFLDTTFSPPVFFLGIPVFFDSFLSPWKKAGLFCVAFVAQMMDGATHERMERWFAAFGVEAV